MAGVRFAETIDVASIRDKAGAIISDVGRFPLDKGQAIRFASTARRCLRSEADDRSFGTGWTVTFADRVQKPPQPLMVVRNVSDPALANVSVPPSPVQGNCTGCSIPTPAATCCGSVTAPPPAPQLIRRQGFVGCRCLNPSTASASGASSSDDVKAELGADKVVLGRPGGLTLSSAERCTYRTCHRRGQAAVRCRGMEEQPLERKAS